MACAELSRIYEGFLLKEGFLAVNLTGEQYIQQEPWVKRNLNLDVSYCGQYPAGVREVVQNWWDRCKAIAGGRNNVEIQHLPNLDNKNVTAYACATLQKQLLGLIIVSKDPSQFCSFLAKNYGTHISMQSMVIGNSSKKTSPSSTGYFGEGIKVEINRLLATNSSVQFHFSNVIWNFVHEVEGSARVLNLHSYAQNSYSTDLSVCIENISSDLVQLDQFLFLQHGYKRNYSSFYAPIEIEETRDRCSGCQLLLEEQNHGCIFAHDILLMRVKRSDLGIHEHEHFSMPFGFNFLGTQHAYGELAITRDRNKIECQPILRQIVHIMHWTRASNLDAYKHLLELLFKWLNNFNDSRPFAYCIHHIPSQLTRHRWQVLADDLLRMLENAHGGRKIVAIQRSTIPDATIRDEQEAHYLSRLPLKVSKDIYDILMLCSNPPSLSNRWKEVEREILALPEPSISEPDKILITTLTNLSVTVFQPHLTPNMILYKRFPEGNSFHTVLRLSENKCYAIDLNRLTISSVHERKSKKTKNFQCPGGMRCNCIISTLMSEFIEMMSRSVNEQSEYWERFSLFLLENSHLQNLDAPKASQSSNSLQAVTTQPSHALPASPPSASQPSEIKTPPPNNPLVDMILVNTVEANSKNSKHQTITPPNLSQIELENIKLQMLQDLNNPSSRCEQPNPMQATSVAIPLIYPGAKDASEAVVIYFTNMKDSFNLKLASLNYSIYCHIYETVIPNGSVRPRPFTVYYDPNTTLLAFNRKLPSESVGEIWFNLARPCTKSLQNWYDELFLVVCHEMAHDVERLHNSNFAHVMAQLVLARTPTYLSACRSTIATHPLYATLQ